MKKPVSILVLLIFAAVSSVIGQAESEIPNILVKKTDDFELKGDGSADQWDQTDWINLPQRNVPESGSRKNTEFKLLYSDAGLYVLFESEDSLVTTPFIQDYEELWRGDVVEVFLWTNQSEPDYFEYEITPLDYELPLIVSNINGELLSWIPFDNTYQGERKVRHKTSVTNGVKKNGAEIDAWIAEIFIPFKLLYPLKNIYPESGSTWRANFYRVDYDHEGANWSWSPFRENFHDYQNFGVLRFE